MRWRLADEIDDPDQLATARDDVVQGWTAAGVVGAMPNIVANRLNSQFNLRGPSFTVSREQLSGSTALQLAARALQRGEVDAAVVGAVDLSCEPVHEAAARVLLGSDEQIPGDAAVVVVLKRADDACRDGDTVLATLPANQKPHGECLHLGTAPGALNLSPLLGHAHAASGLLYVAAGVLYGLLGARPDGTPWTSEERAVVIALNALAGQEQQIVLVPPGAEHRDADELGAVFSSVDRPQRGSPHGCIFRHLPDVRLPNHILAQNTSASRPAEPAYAQEPNPVSAGVTNSDDPPPVPIRTDAAGHQTDTSQLEQPMTTHLPVRQPCPKATEALARVPLGADLVGRTPPEPLSD